MHNSQNPEIRKAANTLANKNLGRILLMCLITFGVIIAVCTAFVLIAALMSMPIVREVMADLQHYSSRRYYTYNALNTLEGLVSLTPRFTVLMLLLFAASLLSAGLIMGLNSGLIRIARGEQPPVTVVFSRLKNCFTGFGLSLWLRIKLMPWILPGFALLILGTLIGSRTQSELPAILGAVIGLPLLLFLLIAALIRYSMASCFIADDPQTGTFGAVARSKAVTDGRKFQLFRLFLPYALILVAIMLLNRLIAWGVSFMPDQQNGLAIGIRIVFGLISLAASIYLGIRISMVQACFYTTNCGALASSDYTPLLKLTMHNRQLRSHAVATVHKNFANVFVIDLLYGLISGAAVIVAIMALILISLISVFSILLTGTSGGALVCTVLSVAIMLAAIMLISALNNGRINAQIRMARGGEAAIPTLFSRMRYCMGSLGLSMWVTLKTFLWALPGIITMVLGILIMAAQQYNYRTSVVDYGMYGTPVSSSIFCSILILIGYVLMFVLVIRATLRYSMASYVYADKPELGVFSAVEDSKWMMIGNKLQLLRLLFPFIFLSTGLSFVLETLIGLGGMIHPSVGILFAALSFIASIVASAYISYLTSMSLSCFYTKYSRWDMMLTPAQAAALPAEPAEVAELAEPAVPDMPPSEASQPDQDEQLD